MCPTSPKPEVIIYSRPGCHLCDEAKAAIQASGSDEYTLTEINIERDPDLLRRYRNDIPVITIDGVEAFKHHITSQAFREKIRNR
jgi:glutaredoxin